MVAAPIAVDQAAAGDQGEIVESPKPTPSRSRMSASAAAANAPPMTAAHDMPDPFASSPGMAKGLASTGLATKTSIVPPKLRSDTGGRNLRSTGAHQRCP